MREDIEHIRGALEVAGYEMELCPEEVLENASKLDANIRTFCANGGPDDVRLIYFTGHGILADDVDWVVPAGVTRKEAAASPNQRVSTDLSKTVSDSDTGLVLFIIDACRDPADVPVTKEDLRGAILRVSPDLVSIGSFVSSAALPIRYVRSFHPQAVSLSRAFLHDRSPSASHEETLFRSKNCCRKWSSGVPTSLRKIQPCKPSHRA